MDSERLEGFMDDDVQEEFEEEELDFANRDRVASLKSIDVQVGNGAMNRHTRDGSSKSTKSLGSASSGADSPLLSPGGGGGGGPAVNYRFFGNIQETIKHPGWMAIFLKFLLKDERPEHFFLFHSLHQYRKVKREDLAKHIAFAHVSVSAPLSPDPAVCPGLTDDNGGKYAGTALELQTVLEQKQVDLQHVRNLLDDLHDDMEASMNERLGAMVELFQASPGIAAGCGAIGSPANPGVCDGWDESDTAQAQEMQGKAQMQELLTPFVDQMAKLRSDVPNSKDPTRLAVYNNALTDVLATLLQKYGIETHANKKSTMAMSKKGKKVHLYNGHPFMVKTFVKPTFCAHCGDLIWGLSKQGWECAMCGMTLHKNSGTLGNPECCHKLTKRCPGARPGEIKKIMKQMSTRASQEAAAARAAASAANTGGGGGGGGSAAVDSGDSGSEDEGEDVPANTRRSFFTSSTLPSDPGKEPKGFSDFVSKEQKDIMKKMYGKSKEMKRQELLYELIQTEKGYYRHLMIMKKVFKLPFERPKGAALLSKADCKTIFGNIEALIKAHKPIADEIAAIQQEGNGAASSPVLTLGARFLEVYRQNCTSPVYQAYCVNAPKGRELLLKKLEESAEFKAKIAEMEGNPECTRLSLKDFLVKPYQRLTKYPLLFKDITEALRPYPTESKKSDGARRLTESERDAEIEVLEELTRISGSNIAIVNQCIADAEDRAKLQVVDAQLKASSGCLTEAEIEYMGDLHEGRKLELDGDVNVLNKLHGSKKSSKHKVRLLLLTDMLLILEEVGHKGAKTYKPFKMERAGFTPMMMLGAMVLKDDKRGGGKNGFFVLTTAKFTLDGQHSTPQLLEFDADTKLMCKKWKEKIDSVSKAYQKEHPTWAADLAETAKERRAAKSTTMPSGAAFKESSKAMGRRASMAAAPSSSRVAGGNAKHHSSLKGQRGPSSAPTSPLKGSFKFNGDEGAPSSPLRPSPAGSGAASAEAIDFAEMDAELTAARQEIQRLKRDNEALKVKLEKAEALQDQTLEESDRLEMEAESLRAEVAALKAAAGARGPATPSADTPPPLTAINRANRQGSYIGGQRAAAPTMAPPPPPSATKPAFSPSEEEYLDVDAAMTHLDSGRRPSSIVLESGSAVPNSRSDSMC